MSPATTPSLGKVAGDYMKTKTRQGRASSSSAACRSHRRGSARTASTRPSRAPTSRCSTSSSATGRRDDAFKVMQDYLTKYPKIDAAGCQDDDMAVGVLEAIKQAKRTDVKFVVGGAGIQGHDQEGDGRRRDDARRRALSAGDGGDRDGAHRGRPLRQGAGARPLHPRRDADDEGERQGVLLPGFARSKDGALSGSALARSPSFTTSGRQAEKARGQTRAGRAQYGHQPQGPRNLSGPVRG